MPNSQRDQNPDVNSYNPDPGTVETPPNDKDDTSGDIEVNKDRGVIPVPPDAQPAAPVEEPPGSVGLPVGDVDDSPTQIA